MRSAFLFFVVFFTSIILHSASELYFCTAANSLYFNHLINLIGSIFRVHYDDLVEIRVFDIGLSEDEKKELEKIEKIAICEIEKIHPDILAPFEVHSCGKTVPGWYAWKPIAIRQCLEKYPYVLWVDAGTTILKNIGGLFEYIEEKGYFLATIGNEKSGDSFLNPIGWQTTRYIREQFNLGSPENSWILDKEAVMASLMGVGRKGQDFFLKPLCTLAYDLRNYEDDGTAPGGFGNCRHDQMLLGVIAYLRNLVIHQQDYTQERPITLNYANQNEQLYITWNGDYVNHKTHIYNSRWDLRSFDYFKKFIRYKNK